ncbi:MAG: LysE family translocator [Puniceicoccales bacterium]|jgi:threonine/homoserine/homoserine lactone efflux protein|nr:LysE family translocator [Puniceicoccales bacterium]
MLPKLATLLGILTIGLLSPGPDFFLIVKNSMSGSRMRAFATGWGIAAGLGIQVSAIALGLGIAPPVVIHSVQLAGAAFLTYVGIKALLSRPDPQTKEVTPASGAVTDADTPPPGSTQSRIRQNAMAGFMEGFLCNVTNVKVFVFFTSLISQFVTVGSPAYWKWVVLATAVIHGAVTWSLIVTALLSPIVSRQLAKAQRWLPKAFGIILIGFATWIVWENLKNGITN